MAAVALAAAFACPATAGASIMVAATARDATLKVTANGQAEADWITGGGGHGSIVIWPSGRLRWGAHLQGRDVSYPATGIAVPVARVVRQTPDGRLWALQAWRRLPGGPVELRFARWQGAPTTLTLQAVCCKWHSENVVGKASFHGKAIYGFHSTPQGAPLDRFGRNVFLDSYRHSRWHRMMGILTHRPTGRFSLWIQRYWLGRAYRGTIIGPNWGWTLGPDAQAETPSTRR
ncbi:MAG: hypothetical protein WBB74_08605, partial [Gaiellaceae bacterium]